jgi:autotransporter-associated beta strand protein
MKVCVNGRRRIAAAVLETLENRRLLAASAIAFLGPDGRLIYAPDAQGDVIPDFSMVGYKTGNVPLPNTAGGVTVPVKRTINPGAPGVDMTSTIQGAIDDVEDDVMDANGFRGAVLLTAGNYPISSFLTINASGVVLMGVGDSSTTGTRLQATGTSTRILVQVDGSGSRSTSGTTYNITDSYVPVGARSFHVDTTASLSVGDSIVITRPSPADWIHDVGMDQIDNSDGGTSQWTPGSRNQNWERTVTAINGNLVTIDIPLTNSLDKQYDGGTFRHYTYSGRINQVGISDMYLYSDSLGAGDLAHATGSITMDRTSNGWINNVTSDGFASNQILLRGGTKFCTIDNTVIQNTTVSSQAPPAGLSMDGPLNLAQNIAMHGVYHAVAHTSVVPGPNVLYNITADGTGSDCGPHQRWSTGGLYDNVTISGNDLQANNRGASGSGHGWAGANYVFWNCSARNLEISSPPTAQNWAIGCTGTKSGDGVFESLGADVSPPQSLYLKQMWDRLHPNPTVQNAATATPNPLGGSLSTSLSVLGAQAGFAESGLTYTWSTLSKPAAASNPTFSANGANAAKNTTATLSQTGTYIFQVTITDAGGLSTTSHVVVTQNAATVISGTAGNDTIQVVRNGASIDVTVNGSTQSIPTTAQLVLNGLGGSDTITVSYSAGNGVPDGGLTIDAGAGSDVVSVIGSSGADAVTLSGALNVSVNGGLFSYVGFEQMNLALASGADTLTASGDASVGVNAMLLNLGGGGSLTMAAASTLPSFTDVNVNGATLSINGQNQTIESLNGNGTVNNSSGTAATLTLDDGVFSGVLANGGSGALSLTKVGAGTLVLSGANSYAGLSTLSGGVIESGNAASFAALMGQVRFNGGTFHVTADTTAANLANKFTTGFSGATSASIGTFDVDTNVTLTIGGPAGASLQTAGGGGSGGPFIKLGAGTLRIISANGQQDDPLLLKQGTIIAEHADALGRGDSGVSIDMVSGTTLILRQDVSTNFQTPIGRIAPGAILNIVLDRLTPGGGVTHSLNSLSTLTTFTLNLTTGANVTSGTAGLALGSVSQGGNGTYSVPANIVLTVSGAITNFVNDNVPAFYSITKTGTGTMVLAGANEHAATTISGGILQIGNGGTTGTPGSGNITNNATLVFSRGDAVTVANVISGTGAVQQSGVGLTNLTAINTYTGATTVNAGTLRVDGSVASSSGVTVGSGATFIAGVTQNLKALTINSGGAANVPAGANKVLRTNVLTLSGTARLDLNDNDIILDYTGSTPMAAIRAALLAGRNNGAWNGNGIFSSVAAAGTGLALGSGEASALGLSSFDGQTIDSTTLLIKFTYDGDATLDGQVDVADLGRLASSWQSIGPWTSGDFDYSNTIDVNDLGLLASNWQRGVGAPLAPVSPRRASRDLSPIPRAVGV